MTTRLLILGGTREATILAERIAKAGVEAVFSYAGRVERPMAQPLPQRIGGFGGIEGLRRFLRDEAITHVVDATHPFAAQMSHNAVAACRAEGRALVALTRPPWAPQTEDRWSHVPDLDGAVAALSGASKRVFLAVGRMHLARFAAQPQHHYLLRLVDPPEGDLPLPNADCVVARGPFSHEGDIALMRAHGVELLVSKNAGGQGAIAKIEAARSLGLPVLMIDRPKLPERQEVATPDAVLGWLAHSGTDLGV